MEAIASGTVKLSAVPPEGVARAVHSAPHGVGVTISGGWCTSEHIA